MKKLLVVISLVSLFFVGCEKDPELTGNPSNNTGGINIQVVDSFVLGSYTVEEEPISGKTINRVLLGRINDSRMGNAAAAFYSQFRLTVNAFDLGANPVLDSVVLSLAVSDVYGPNTIATDFTVYQLETAIDADESYDNNTVLNVAPTAIGTLQGYVHNNQDAIRIPLTNTFGNALIGEFGTITMESSDNFLTFLKGIYVASNAASGGDMLYTLDLTNANTQIELYYSSDNATDSVYTYVVNNQSESINQYNDDFSGSELETYLNDATDNDVELFLAPLTGTRAHISLPDLSALEGVIINKAEISFYQADYASVETMNFPEPENIFLYRNIADTSINFLPDFSISDPTPFGGLKELTMVNGMNTNQYTFTITEYIQQLLKGQLDNDGLVVSVASHNQGDRVRIGGGTHADFPIQLKITYSEAQ